MLKNFWYAVEFSHAITEHPKRITVLNRDLVVYRTSDRQVVAAEDRCAHRGVALSQGYVENNCIVCPYHGWAFQADGTCTRIPANNDATIPHRAKIATYPVQEKYGWVWVFIGDLSPAECPSIPQLPHFDDASLKAVYGDFYWQTHYTRAVENLLDFAHAPFVHGGSFGNPDKPQVPDFTVSTFDYGAEAFVEVESSPPKGIWGFLAQKEPKPVPTRTAFFMPNITLLEINLPFGKLILYNSHLPINATNTVSKWIALRSFIKGDWADQDSRKRVLKIFKQDGPIVESQRPQAIPYDIGAEVHVQADALQVQYRKMRRQFIDMGWSCE